MKRSLLSPAQTPVNVRNPNFVTQITNILSQEILVENLKLRKLLTKGPNYRESRTINFNKCISAITSALTVCITIFRKSTKSMQ